MIHPGAACAPWWPGAAASLFVFDFCPCANPRRCRFLPSTRCWRCWPWRCPSCSRSRRRRLPTSGRWCFPGPVAWCWPPGGWCGGGGGHPRPVRAPGQPCRWHAGVGAAAGSGAGWRGGAVAVPGRRALGLAVDSSVHTGRGGGQPAPAQPAGIADGAGRGPCSGCGCGPSGCSAPVGHGHGAGGRWRCNRGRCRHQFAPAPCNGC